MSTIIRDDHPDYTRIYASWLENGKPARIQLGAKEYLQVTDNNEVYFILLSATDKDYYLSSSMPK